MTLDRRRARLAVIRMAASILLAGCYTGPSAQHFAGVVDQFVAPETWKLQKSVVQGPGEAVSCEPSTAIQCPGAYKMYRSPEDVRVTYDTAKHAVEAAGFPVTREIGADCGGPASGAACSFSATAGGDEIYVSVFRSGRDTGVSELGDAGTVVSVLAHR
jgi:hypothetical protein